MTGLPCEPSTDSSPRLGPPRRAAAIGRALLALALFGTLAACAEPTFAVRLATPSDANGGQAVAFEVELFVDSPDYEVRGAHVSLESNWGRLTPAELFLEPNLPVSVRFVPENREGLATVIARSSEDGEALGLKKIQIHYVAGVGDVAPIADELEAR